MAAPLIQAVVLDVSEESWGDSAPANSTIQSTMQTLSLDMVWVSALAFLRALQVQGVSCALYFSSAQAAGRLFPLGNEALFTAEVLMQRLEKRLEERSRGGVWKAVSQVLCFLHGRSPARILIIQHTEVRERQKEAMCAIGAAKKLGVVLDAVSINECPVLEQATTLTGGVVVRHSSNGLLQILLQVFLPTCRQLLAQPAPKPTLLWPSCVCHGNPIDMAFACSSCLSLYCGRSESTCRTCGARLLFSS